MTTVFGPDPVEQELARVLALLDAGTFARDESSLIDLKEEAGRRDRQGTVRPGEPRNDRAAEQVAGESACIANTPGGGALVLGAADDGTLIGTALDVECINRWRTPIERRVCAA